MNKLAATTVAILTTAIATFRAFPKTVKEAAAKELGAFLETATPTFHVDAITAEDFENTCSRRARIEMINAFNNARYENTVRLPGKGNFFIAIGTAFAMAGVCRYTGMDVYLIDADLETEPALRCPVWVIQESRIGRKVNAERRVELHELLPETFKRFGF